MTIRYCQHGLATGSDDGTSWENAYRSIYSASALASGDTMWVKAGTIDVSGGSITPSAAITIHGGFDVSLTGTDGNINNRTGITVLDGLYNTSYSAISTAYSITASRISLVNLSKAVDCIGHIAGGATWILDDCTISNITCSTGNPISSSGSIVLNRCDLSNFQGYATAIITGGNITLVETSIHECGDEWKYALLQTISSAIGLYSCKIYDNYARYGILDVVWGTIEVVNSIFYGNTMRDGSVVSINLSTAVDIVNASFVENTLTSTSSITGVVGIVDSSGIAIANTIVYGNNIPSGIYVSSGTGGSIYNSDIEDLASGGVSGFSTISNCVDTDPVLLGTGDDPCELSSFTPVSVSRGGNTGATGYVDYDILNVNRDDSAPSMGAYEYTDSGGESYVSIPDPIVNSQTFESVPSLVNTVSAPYPISNNISHESVPSFFTVVSAPSPELFVFGFQGVPTMANTSSTPYPIFEYMTFPPIEVLNDIAGLPSITSCLPSPIVDSEGYTIGGADFSTSGNTVRFGDASTLGACGTLVESTVVSEAVDEISGVFAKGALSAGPIYVYVTNADDQTNSAGFEVELQVGAVCTIDATFPAITSSINNKSGRNNTVSNTFPSIAGTFEHKNGRNNRLNAILPTITSSFVHKIGRNTEIDFTLPHFIGGMRLISKRQNIRASILRIPN